MKKILRENFALIVAFSLPVALLLGVFLMSFIPSLFLRTDYDFIYVRCDGTSYNYYHDNCKNYINKKYQIVSGSLVVRDVDLDSFYRELYADRYNYNTIKKNEIKTRLYLHDTEENTSREITETQAQQYIMQDLRTSPDGASVEGNYNGGADLFLVFDVGSSNYDYYLVKGNARKKLNLIGGHDRSYYSDRDFHFLSWVQ